MLLGSVSCNYVSVCLYVCLYGLPYIQASNSREAKKQYNPLLELIFSTNRRKKILMQLPAIWAQEFEADSDLNSLIYALK